MKVGKAIIKIKKLDTKINGYKEKVKVIQSEVGEG